MTATRADMPFSARYSLPVYVAESLKKLSWENVIDLSSDFQMKAEAKSTKIRKLIKELQLSRLILMERIKQAEKEGKIEPKLLVDTVKLLQKCERIAEDYDLDIHEFSTFLYLIAEKLKKEKLAHYIGPARMKKIAPIKEELAKLKRKSEKRRGRR